jgi:hypothetical protein
MFGHKRVPMQGGESDPIDALLTVMRGLDKAPGPLELEIWVFG